MKKYLKITLFGFLVWLIVFIVSILISPLKTATPALFESIMPVVITICTLLFLIIYLRKQKTSFLKTGIIIGSMWLVINIILDLLLFMWGPMKMTLLNYLMDIGLTYLIIPVVTTGLGYSIDRHLLTGNG